MGKKIIHCFAQGLRKVVEEVFASDAGGRPHGKSTTGSKMIQVTLKFPKDLLAQRLQYFQRSKSKIHDLTKPFSTQFESDRCKTM